MEVIPFSDLPNRFVTTHSEYVLSYLEALGCRTAVIENHYVDKGYMIDYSRFHARSFDAPSRFVTRFHFFAREFGGEYLGRLLADGNGDEIKGFCDGYLGFAAVKPLRNEAEEPLLGRTVLKTYPAHDGADSRQFLTTDHSSSLYGIPLSVQSLPYQTQDIAVGACASAALWVSMYPLSGLFQTPILSLSEITERAMTAASESRTFPSLGLTLAEMMGVVRGLGLDPEVQNIDPGMADWPVVQDTAKAYIRCGLPVIAALELAKAGQSRREYHAVVISGYRCDENLEVKELYVHDDQIGPYSRVRQDASFASWRNEWVDKRGYTRVLVQKLVIPVYPKIRLPFGRIYGRYRELKAQIQQSGFSPDLFLIQVNSYKKFLLANHLRDKVEILTSPFPRFLWVIRAHHRGTPVFDRVFDGTSVYPKLFRTILFE